MLVKSAFNFEAQCQAAEARIDKEIAEAEKELEGSRTGREEAR